MGTVKRLAQEVKRGLDETHPELRKPVVSQLALAVGAMIEGRTPNTVELANLLPLETQRQDMREQWLRRLLKNPLLNPEQVMAPLARRELEEAGAHGQTVLLSMDQSDLGDRMAVLMVSVRVGDRSLPLAWIAEEGAANIGFEGQWLVLERVRGWLPTGAAVMLIDSWLGRRDTVLLEQFVEQLLRDVAFVAEQFTAEPAYQLRHRLAIVDITGGELKGQQFAPIIDHQVQLEAVEPAGGSLASAGKLLEHLMTVNPAEIVGKSHRSHKTALPNPALLHSF